MRVTDLGEPCRNFCVQSPVLFRDPRDGREKVGFASDVSGGGRGLAVIIDPDTGQGESYVFPGDSGAFAVLNLHDDALLFGTAHHKGYLLRLDLRDRTWAEPLRDEGETYLWELCVGPDGMVYAGTYPGCALLRCDPGRHTLENLGRASENPRNLYSRRVSALPNHILIRCVTAAPHFAVWDVARGVMSPLGKAFSDLWAGAIIEEGFFALPSGDGLEFYDSQTLQPISRPEGYAPPERAEPHTVTLSDDRQLVIQGQDYCLRRPGQPDTSWREIPVPRPATGILTIISDPAGKVWGSTAYGQTIFRYDPQTEESWNSGGVCTNTGEVYGMAFCRGRLFMTAYSGGDHVVYDPARPWNQRDNTNPCTIGDLEGKLVRPLGRSVVGPDGAVWTGWQARYGVYGGGLSRVDTETLEIDSWYDPIPGQAVVGVAADDRWLYFITAGWGNGLPEKVEPFHLAIWDAAGGIAWRHQYEEGIRLTSVSAGFGVVLVSAGGLIQVLDPATRQFRGQVDIGAACYCMRPYRDGLFAVFCGARLLLIDPRTMTVHEPCELPASDVATATVTPEGTLYFASGSHLYRASR